MAYNVTFSGPGFSDGPFFLCPTGDWTAFLGWVDTLPLDGFSKVRGLAANGKVEGTDVLAVQLRLALDKGNPDQLAADTARALVKRTGVGAPDETVTITD